MRRLLAGFSLALAALSAHAQMNGGVMESQKQGTASITAGTINGATIGATTPAAGTFTSVGDTGLSVTAVVCSDGSKVLTSTCSSAAPSFAATSVTTLTASGAINKVTVTPPATAATLTIANNKTATINNTLTFAGTDSTTMTFPATTGTVCASGNACTVTSLTPSTTTGIVGSSTNDTAAAGSVGETLSQTASSVTVNTASVSNVTTITLTAGDWNVTGAINTAGSGATNNNIRYGISQTSASFSGSTAAMNDLQAACNVTAQVCSGVVPVHRISVAGSTQIWLVAQAGTAIITTAMNGYIMARRVR